MGFGRILMHFRVWWFLRIATNATIPADVGRYLIALRNSNSLALNELERTRQAIIDEGAGHRKTISTEAVLRLLLKRKTTYDGPDREEYVSEIDRLADEFRKKYGPQIPVDQAYAMSKELETRYGRAE